MPGKIAVAVIHGVGKQEPGFAQPMIDKLLPRIASLIGVPAKDLGDHIVFESIHWAPAVQPMEDELWPRLQQGGPLDYLSLRGFIVNFLADAIAYQPIEGERDVYQDIHDIYAAALSRLAIAAGPRAPLCIIAHSLGTVITSNYVYDLQAAHRRPMPLPAGLTMESSPLELGETLTGLYTMGSPIALWTLRYPGLGKPIAMPHVSRLAELAHLPAEWVNIYDKDDVIGYPLRQLSAEYEASVAQDVAVNAGGLLSSWNPLSHNEYWTDRDVTGPIAEGLAWMWATHNGISEMALAIERGADRVLPPGRGFRHA